MFVILVPVAMLAVVAIYVLFKMTMFYIIDKLERVYRYASGKHKDSNDKNDEAPSTED